MMMNKGTYLIASQMLWMVPVYTGEATGSPIVIELTAQQVEAIVR